MGTALRINIETGVEEFIEVPDAATIVPEVVTRRQARRALLEYGFLEQVEPTINAMASPDREVALIEWQDATEFRRDHFLIAQIGTAFGLTESDIDDLFYCGGRVLIYVSCVKNDNGPDGRGRY